MQDRPMTKLPTPSFIRMAALPACMVWGMLEFIALQRARLHLRRPQG